MRLIDADKLVDMDGGQAIDYIVNGQADYDVDKVVEQLDDYLFEKYCIEGENDVEKIVRGGGLDE